MALSEEIDKKIVLLIAVLTSFIVPFMVSSINIALPTIGKEFQMGAILLSWIATAYIMTSAMLTIPFGRLADIHGRRKIFILGLFGYAVSSLLCGLSLNPYFLIAFRVLQGIAGSMIFATNISILTTISPPQERG
ncbi:MAG: MFS transporter, partial [Synergistetes bacterium]|nr:MFS transporter [Synergistota bacterium]